MRTHLRTLYTPNSMVRTFVTVSAIVLLSLINSGSAQLVASLSGTPDTLVPGDTIDLVCNFTTNPLNGTFVNISFTRNVTGEYEILYEYDVTSNLTTKLNTFTGDMTGVLAPDGMSYQLTLTNLTEADSGIYQCQVEDSNGNTDATPPTIPVTVSTMAVTTTQMTTSTDPTTVVMPCLSSPCANGNCTDDGVGGYTCQCIEGFTGTNCDTDINECDSLPCQNSGTCMNLLNSYNCQCTTCYNGTNCENEISNACSSNPCQNGATCINNCPSYTCDCPITFFGDTCDQVCDNIANLTAIQSYVLNSDVTLTCDAKNPSDNIFWSKSLTGTPHLATGISTLTLSKVGPDDVTSYHCFVSSSTCTDRRSTRVEVQWDISPSNITTSNKTWYLGEDKTLSCRVTSNPVSLVEWIFTPSSESTEQSSSNTTEAPAGPRTLTSANSTAGNLTLNITNVKKDNGGMYECVATLPHLNPITIQLHAITIGDKGLKWWHILLIVLAVLILIGLVVGLLVYFCIKKGKARTICPSDKAMAAEKHKSEKPETRPSEKEENGNYKASSRGGGYNYSSPSRTPRTRYDEEDEEEKPSARRALPKMPATGGSRGGIALQPLDIDNERKKLKKKKKKKAPETVAEEDAETGEGHDDQGDEDDGYGKPYSYRSY